MPRLWGRFELELWEKQRRRGFFGFVMVWGVGAFGLSSGVLFAAIWTFTQNTTHLQQPWGLLGFWLLCLLAFAGGGFWWGATMWCVNEAIYKWHLRKSGREPRPPVTGDPDAG